MGAAVSFIKGHGKRIINRYNAQYKALAFLEKEKLPAAPRHSTVSDEPDTLGILTSPVKDLKLNEYLKDIYIRSLDEDAHKTGRQVNSSSKPYPQNRDSLNSTVLFREPEEIEKGYCTLTQAVKFMSDFGNDSEANKISKIAQQYCLDTKKVDAVLSYYAVFKIFDDAKDTLPATMKLNDTVDKMLTETGSNHEEISRVTHEMKEKKEKVFS